MTPGFPRITMRALSPRLQRLLPKLLPIVVAWSLFGLFVAAAIVLGAGQGAR
jgi:hypothetical protein